MFARPSTHFCLLQIFFISLIATQTFADNLFTDWAPSNLNDVTISDSNNNDQLLAFNNEASSNMFTSDSSTNDFSMFDSSTTVPLNQASTGNPPLDTSNMFLDSTPLDSLDTVAFDSSGFDDKQALPALPNDPLGGDATSPDLLANGASGGCSSFGPSSSRRKTGKRESADMNCPAPPSKENSFGAQPEINAAKEGFFDKDSTAKNEAYKRIVCPSAHYGAAVTIPVCSSPDIDKMAWSGFLVKIYPGSLSLADSTLCQSLLFYRLMILSRHGWLISLYQFTVLWWSASVCVGGARRPYCCQEWNPNVFKDIVLPGDPRYVSFPIDFTLADS